MDYCFLFLLAIPIVTPKRQECGHLMQYCGDPLQILTSIKGYPDNYQQLLNAFYPINQARPSSVIIAYFTYYTDPLPQECEQLRDLPMEDISSIELLISTHFVVFMDYYTYIWYCHFRAFSRLWVVLACSKLFSATQHIIPILPNNANSLCKSAQVTFACSSHR